MEKFYHQELLMLVKKQRELSLSIKRARNLALL